MTVKFRTVYAGKFHFISYHNTTGSAHAGTVHHDRVHADNSRNVQFLCCQAAEFHHDHRTNRYAVIIYFSFFCYQVFDHFCYHSASSVRTVIGCNIEIACHFGKFLFQDNQIFCLCTDNNIRINAVLMQPFHLWIYWCSTYTTSYKKDLFLFYFFERLCAQVRRLSQRTYEITESISCLQCGKFLCGRSDRLEYNSNCTGFSVIVTNSQRNTLADFIHFYDDKLSRQTMLCNTRSLYNHLVDIACKFSCF